MTIVFCEDVSHAAAIRKTPPPRQRRHRGQPAAFVRDADHPRLAEALVPLNLCMTDSAPAALPFGDYIVFVDESGDHSLASINPDYPVFVLAFCIVSCAAYIEQITSAVRRLKMHTFGHDLVILHEHDLRKKTGPFRSSTRSGGRRCWMG